MKCLISSKDPSNTSLFDGDTVDTDTDDAWGKMSPRPSKQHDLLSFISLTVITPSFILSALLNAFITNSSR